MAAHTRDKIQADASAYLRNLNENRRLRGLPALGSSLTSAQAQVTSKAPPAPRAAPKAPRASTQAPCDDEAGVQLMARVLATVKAVHAADGDCVSQAESAEMTEHEKGMLARVAARYGLK